MVLSHGQDLLTLVSLQEHAGPSLSGELNSLAIQACQLTSQFLKKAFLDQASPAEVKTSVGMVLQACEALERAPLTNKQAVGKKFVQVASSYQFQILGKNPSSRHSGQMTR